MIVITTPTGQIGRQVLGNLLDSGEQLRVIARDPSKLPAGVRKDLDIVEGSHGDAAVVDKAFAGADAVLWLTPADRRAPSVDAAFAGFTGPAAEAFTRHGVGRVVGVSMLGRGTPWAGRAGFVTGSLAMDDLIAASGVAYRALANPYFMEDTLLQADSIKNQGLFFSPIAGDRKLPAVATRDIAAAASRLLRDASWTGAGEVPTWPAAGWRRPPVPRCEPAGRSRRSRLRSWTWTCCWMPTSPSMACSSRTTATAPGRSPRCLTGARCGLSSATCFRSRQPLRHTGYWKAGTPAARSCSTSRAASQHAQFRRLRAGGCRTALFEGYQIRYARQPRSAGNPPTPRRTG